MPRAIGNPAVRRSAVVGSTDFCHLSSDGADHGLFSQPCIALHSSTRQPLRAGRPSQGRLRKDHPEKGEGYVGLLDADRLDYYRPERKRIHLPPIADARHGPADIAAGYICEADAALIKLQQCRALTTTAGARGRLAGKAAKPAEK